LFWRAGPTTSRVICPLPAVFRPDHQGLLPSRHNRLPAEGRAPPAAASSSRLLVQSRGSSFSSSHAVWICSRQQHEAICRSAAAPGRSNSRVLDLQHEAPLSMSSAASNPSPAAMNQSPAAVNKAPLKRNSDDIGWEYGVLINPDDLNVIKCKLCPMVVKAGIYRLKLHIAGKKGQVRSCPNAKPFLYCSLLP